jgi:hypothetical protein
MRSASAPLPPALRVAAPGSPRGQDAGAGIWPGQIPPSANQLEPRDGSTLVSAAPANQPVPSAAHYAIGSNAMPSISGLRRAGKSSESDREDRRSPRSHPIFRLFFCVDFIA